MPNPIFILHTLNELEIDLDRIQTVIDEARIALPDDLDFQIILDLKEIEIASKRARVEAARSYYAMNN